jgi:hypothetical protein
MRTNISAFFAAVASILIGLLILFEPHYYSGRYRRYVDFGDFREISALVFIIGGIVVLWLSSRCARGAKKIGDVICPKCENTAFAGDPDKPICPRCKVPMEKLEIGRESPRDQP